MSSQTIACPYCWEQVEIVVDLSVAEQQYVEDCFVCCRPIVIRYVAEQGTVTELTASAENA